MSGGRAPINLRDEQLAARAQAGDDRARDELVARFRPMCEAVASGFFLAGADRDDTIQEALIGLTGAIRNYEPDMVPGFSGFAHLCIRRQVMTAVKTALRQKHVPLNTSVRVTYVEGTDYLREFDIVDQLPAPDLDDAANAKEKLAVIVALVPTLTALERKAIAMVLNGVPYTHGCVMDKQIDNAVQRARRKLRAGLAEHLELAA